MPPDNEIRPTIDVQGHRGCRGLMPENTLPAFMKAMDIGVRTLELDVVISADLQVIVSHEAFFNHELTSSVKGTPVEESNEKSFNLYTMQASEILSIDVGSKVNPKFPHQLKMKAYKPLLSDVLRQCDAYAKSKKYALPYYNIEIKRDKSLDGKFNPDAKEFVKLVYDVMHKFPINGRFNIQSFDHETLSEYHLLDAYTPTAMLVMDKDGLISHLERLNHKPYAYSPYYKLVTKELVADCHQKNIKIIPWTVNDAASVKALLDLNVDGIISDYPDMVIDQVNLVKQ
jgi:glycerophosphoryl diester phosphodiesterase